MGEIADMMMDGTLCQTCGEFMDHEGSNEGYPVSCPGCIEMGDAPKRDPIVTDTALAAQKLAKRRRKRQRYKANKAARLKAKEISDGSTEHE